MKKARIVRIVLLMMLSFVVGALSLVMLFDYKLSQAIDNEWVGIYLENAGWVLLKIKGASLGEIKSTLHHETGHILWDKCMNETQRVEYASIYFLPDCPDTEESIKTINDILSKEYYGPEELVEEVFARDYEDWTLRRGWLLCKQKQQFFHYNRCEVEI